MKKKYQIFISSTYTDLLDERQAAVEAVLIAGHIPAGMELFCAGDEGQLEVIKRWIDESDIYCLILGARYGSIDPKSGLSYTELEYDYAVEQRKPHFALVLSEAAVQKKVQSLGATLFERNDGVALKRFREKALSKIVRPVDDVKDIKLYTLEAIRGLENRYQLEGWVRSSEVVDVGPLGKQLERMASEREQLEERLAALRDELSVATSAQQLAGLEDSFPTTVSWRHKHVAGSKEKPVVARWGEIFAMIAPKLLENPNDVLMRRYIAEQLLAAAGEDVTKAEFARIPESDHNTIKVHLIALGLIQTKFLKTVANNMALFWSLTPKGHRKMLELRSVKKQAI